MSTTTTIRVGKHVPRPVANKSGHDMARVEMAPEVVEDFDRILEYQAQHNSRRRC